MHAYILLDRSGSMQTLWVEALSSVNAYAKELANKKDGNAVDSHITFAVFDGQEGLQFDVLRRKQPALHWETVTDREASPRGMTPLLDAMIRIVALADADNPLASLPSRAASASEKSPVEMPLRYRIGSSVSIDLERRM